jgi:NAD(P)-dependent dehydrogenase (short-subunit alcohol dehydrogenase family)
MASIHMDDSSIPGLAGKTAVVTGGASGIGLAAARLLSRKGAVVHVLDLSDMDEDGEEDDNSVCRLHLHRCDVSSWVELRAAFVAIGPVDYVFANAAVTEQSDYFADMFDDDGQLRAPDDSFQRVLDVNLRGVLYVVKLALSTMRKSGTQGSIVITTSATAYAPEQSLPVYAAAKAGVSGFVFVLYMRVGAGSRSGADIKHMQLVGLIRALRSRLPRDGITINGVAPAATITNMLPDDLAAPIMAMGLPVSTAAHVGRALVYAATAQQPRRVAVYGRDGAGSQYTTGERWNGRIILTLGETYTELEEPLSDLRPWWLGRENERLTGLQQAATDSRT